MCDDDELSHFMMKSIDSGTQEVLSEAPFLHIQYPTAFLSFSAPWRVRRLPVTSLYHLHLWQPEEPIRLGQKHLQYQYTFRPKLTALTFVSLCSFSKLKAEGWV